MPKVVVTTARKTERMRILKNEGDECLENTDLSDYIWKILEIISD